MCTVIVLAGLIVAPLAGGTPSHPRERRTQRRGFSAPSGAPDEASHASASSDEGAAERELRSSWTAKEVMFSHDETAVTGRVPGVRDGPR